MIEKKVISVHNKWRANGEWNEERIQYLQEKRKRCWTIFGLLSKHYWVTIDSEIVPSHVWLRYAIFGSDIDGWKSKFAQYI